MTVVSGGNHDDLDVLSGNERIGIGGRAREAVLVSVVRGGDAAGAGDTRQTGAACYKSWNQHASGVIAGADEGQLRLGTGRRVRCAPVGYYDARPKAHRIVVRVFEQDAKVWLRLRGG